MNVLGYIKSDLNRAILSRQFIYAVLGVVFISLFNCYEDLFMYKEEWLDVLYFYHISETNTFAFFYIIFAVYPFATSYYLDSKNRYSINMVIRGNVRGYVYSKVVVTAICGGLVVLVGQVIFILILSTIFPFVNFGSPLFSNISQLYGGNLLVKKQYILYFFLKIFGKFFTASFFSVVALLSSTIFQNLYVTLSTPLLIFYPLRNIFNSIALSKYTNLVSVLSIEGFNNYLLSFCYSIIIVTMLIMMLMGVTYKLVLRRVSNE